jgi:hypothetical protein
MPVHIGDRPRRKHGSAHGDRRAAHTRPRIVGKTGRTPARSPVPARAQTASACSRLAPSPYRCRCSPGTAGYSGPASRRHPRRDRRRRRPHSSGHSQSTPRCNQQAHRTPRQRPSGAPAASPPRESSHPFLGQANRIAAWPRALTPRPGSSRSWSRPLAGIHGVGGEIMLHRRLVWLEVECVARLGDGQEVEACRPV